MSLIANCDSFEFIVSSDAVSTIKLLITRFLKMRIDKNIVYDVIIDESEMTCRLQFDETNLVSSQLAHMFFFAKVLRCALIQFFT